jgi:two-component system NtrC family response regulator
MRILVVDDEVKMTTLVAGALEDEGHEVVQARSGRDAIAALSDRGFDMVVTDLKMPPPGGIAVLKHCRALPDPPEVVLMTAHGSVATAVEAMKIGAHDYLSKPFELDELVAIAARVHELRVMRREREALRAENRRLVERLGDAGAGFEGIVGESPVMKEVFALARKVAESDATVLIRGESGTGKGRFARAIHALSPRGSRPFVKINCGALPETLLESELFGHEKGAFTGADRQKPGRFELAEGGTVFLDEIGEVSPALQVKLLQVLEEKQFTRVGGIETLSCDVRLIAATHRDLEAMIREREFREDLFYRLNVFPIEMPPLRARGNDVVLLVHQHLRSRGRDPDAISPDALRALLGYGFPGNVRELQNLLERAMILAGGGTITLEHFPSLEGGGAAGSPAERSGFIALPDGGLSLEAVERDLIVKALEKAGGNKSQTARLLGITRRTLYSRMEKHGLLTPGGPAVDAEDDG